MNHATIIFLSFINEKQLTRFDFRISVVIDHRQLYKSMKTSNHSNIANKHEQSKHD